MKYEELAAIDVSGKVEKKNGLSYLSWAWALDQLLRRDESATWEYLEPMMFGETMMIRCTVTAFGKARTAQLPVMDHRNKPIPNPDAFQVNTAMQRCLAKAIALHGIGLYIYAGEDIPPSVQGDTASEALVKRAREAADKGNESFRAFWKELDEASRKSLGSELGDLKARVEKAKEEA